MTDDESADMIKVVVDTVGGVVPVIAGTGRAATRLPSREQACAGPGHRPGDDHEPLLPACDRGMGCTALLDDRGAAGHRGDGLRQPDHLEGGHPAAADAAPVQVPNIIGVKENGQHRELLLDAACVGPGRHGDRVRIGHLTYLFEAPLGCPAFVTELVCFAPEIAFAIYDAAVKRDYVAMKGQLTN